MRDRSAVIVGGGITGTLVARALARAGAQVTLLEAAALGSGSSSRTAAGIRQQFGTPATVRGMRYAVRFYKEFANEVEGHTCPIVQRGYLFLAGDASALDKARARVAVQRGAGLAEVELLEGAVLRDRFPWVGEAIAGGTFCPTDGFLLPHLVYQEAARSAVQAGATILQNAPVLSVTHAGGRAREVLTPKGRFGADLFIDCTNAWTRRTAALFGATDLPVDPLKRYLWFLDRGTAMTAETLATMPLVIGPTGTYCRPENADRLLMGKIHEAAPEPEFDRDDQDRIEPFYDHRSGTDGWPYVAWAELAETIPAVAEMDGIRATTSGFYATTPDHNPFLAYDPVVPNLMRLVGFSGHGAMFGPFTAAVALALAEAGHDLDAIQVDGEAVAIDAFRIGRSYEHAEDLVI